MNVMKTPPQSVLRTKGGNTSNKENELYSNLNLSLMNSGSLIQNQDNFYLEKDTDFGNHLQQNLQQQQQNTQQQYHQQLHQQNTLHGSLDVNNQQHQLAQNMYFQQYNNNNLLDVTNTKMNLLNGNNNNNIVNSNITINPANGKSVLLSPEFSSPQIHPSSDIDSSIQRINPNQLSKVSNIMMNTNRSLNDSDLNANDKNSKDSQRIKLVVPLPPSPPKFDKAKNVGSSTSSSSNNVNIASHNNTASALTANDTSCSEKPAGMNDTNDKKKDRKDNSSSTNGRKSKKVKGPQICEIPLPNELPKIEFHSVEKPPYSYASLIGMALLRSDERRLTLSQIYNWISSTFRYYKRGEVGWQNSIRHNLSLNRSFEKSERSKDGKGHFWKIVEGYEYQFLKNKNGKKSAANVKNAKPSNENNNNSSAKSNEIASSQLNVDSNILSSPLSLKSRSNSNFRAKANISNNSQKSQSEDTAAGENDNNDEDDDDEDDEDDDTFHIRKNRQNKNSGDSPSSLPYASLSTTANAASASSDRLKEKSISHTAGSSISSSSSSATSSSPYSSSTDIIRHVSINNNSNKGDPAMLIPVRSSNLLLSTPTSIKNSFNALNNGQLNSIPENHAQLNSWSKINPTPTTSLESCYISQTHLSPFQTRNMGAYSFGGNQIGNKLQGRTTNSSGVTITINGSSEQEQRELDQSSLTSSFASFHDSPGPLYATKNIPFTSSFSCKSNFDLSPIKSSETGPLLEPLTPVYNPNSIGNMGISLSHNIGASFVSKALNNYTGSDLNSIANGKQNSSSIVSKTLGSNKISAANKNLNGIPSASNNSILPSSYYFNNNLESPSPSLNNITNKLISKHGNSHTYQSGLVSGTNGVSLSNSANQNSYANNNPGAYISNDINRTPLNILRTPKSDSVMKRLWNSPVSYLEDFYALSPIAINKGSVMGNVGGSATNPVNINNTDSSDSNRLLPPLSSAIFGSGGHQITNKIDDFVLSDNVSSSTDLASLKRDGNNNCARKEHTTNADSSTAIGSGSVSSTGPTNTSAPGLISSVDYFGSPLQNIKKRKLNTRDSIISGGTSHHGDINNGYSYDTVGSSNYKEFNENNKRRLS